MTIASRKIATPAAAAPPIHNAFSLISNQKLLQLYTTMLQCRMIEERLRPLLKKNKVEVIAGRGRLVDRHTIEVTSGAETRKVSAHHLILATGSEPAKPASFPFDGKSVLTSDDALRLQEIPKSLLEINLK